MSLRIFLYYFLNYYFSVDLDFQVNIILIVYPVLSSLLKKISKNTECYFKTNLKFSKKRFFI